MIDVDEITKQAQMVTEGVVGEIPATPTRSRLASIIRSIFKPSEGRTGREEIQKAIAVETGNTLGDVLHRVHIRHRNNKIAKVNPPEVIDEDR